MSVIVNEESFNFEQEIDNKCVKLKGMLLVEKERLASGNGFYY